MANGTGMPEVSRPRNRTVTIRICSSAPIMRVSAPRQRAETPHMGAKSPNDRDAQRRDADRHCEARQPKRCFEERRRALAEPVGRELEPDEVPQQNGGK